MRPLGFPRLLLAIAMALVAYSGIGATVSAQESTYTTGVAVVNCDINPPEYLTVPEPGCNPGVGITYVATDSGGAVVDSCTSATVSADSFTGSCSLSIPWSLTVSVTQDASTLPAGYAPLENPVMFTAPDGPPDGEYIGPVFINMLQDSGSDEGDNGESEGLFTMGVVVVNCDIQAPEYITVPQDGCSPGVGIEYVATDASGTVVDTCVSATVSADSFTGGCTMEIPFGSTVNVSQNPGTVPAGYVDTRGDQAFTAPDGPPDGEVGGPVFVNMLQVDDSDDSGEDTVTPEPEADDDSDTTPTTVSSLPETGSGIQAAAGTEIAMMITGLLALATGTLLRRFDRAS